MEEENQNLLDNVSWDAIIGSIQQDKCIICVGPGVYAENGVRLEEQIIQHLKPHAERLKIRIYDDGWIHYLPGYNFVEPYMKIKEFYQKPFPTAQRMLQKLGQIQFHFYITSTPDQKLREALNDYPHRFEFYFKNKPYQDGEHPSKDQPLVYNMLGEINQRESLVLTYDDFYSYLGSIFSEKSMSPKIRESIQDADNFIFLGLPFDQWYMHLFLRILEQHKNKNQLKYAPSNYVPEKVQSYCNEQFNITFVPLKEETFVDELFKRCTAAGLIRQPGNPSSIQQSFPSEVIRNQISENQIDEAFTSFFEALNQHPVACKHVIDQLTVLRGQFTNLKERMRLNLIANEEATRERSQINYGILNLVNDAEACAKTR